VTTAYMGVTTLVRECVCAEYVCVCDVRVDSLTRKRELDVP